MIKAMNQGALVLGLSDANIERLKAGEPILFDMSELGKPPMKVFIFNGRTEDSMYQDMKHKVHPYLTTIIDKRAEGKN